MKPSYKTRSFHYSIVTVCYKDDTIKERMFSDPSAETEFVSQCLEDKDVYSLKVSSETQDFFEEV